MVTSHQGYRQAGRCRTFYVLSSRDGCLDNTPKAPFQPNHLVFLTNKFNENLPQRQSMDGEKASMPSSPFKCETPAQEQHHRTPKRTVTEEGEVSQAPEKTQKSKQSKLNDIFKRRK